MNKQWQINRWEQHRCCATFGIEGCAPTPMKGAADIELTSNVHNSDIKSETDDERYDMLKRTVKDVYGLEL